MAMQGIGNSKQHSELTGTLYTTYFTRDFWVLACSDCTTGFVGFYYKSTLESAQQLQVGKIFAPYELAGYQDTSDINKFQIFIAGGDTIDMVEYMEDPSTSSKFFKLSETIWQNPNPIPDGTLDVLQPTMYIAKSHDYLSFKITNENSIYMMATCDYYQTFNSANFTCDACQNFLRSWGMQSTECIPCGTMMLEHDGDDINKAMYRTVCTEGQTKSWIIMVATGLGTLLISCICCVINMDLCKDMEDYYDKNITQKARIPIELQNDNEHATTTR